jgi:hypothetical protein
MVRYAIAALLVLLLVGALLVDIVPKAEALATVVGHARPKEGSSPDVPPAGVASDHPADDHADDGAPAPAPSADVQP